MLFGEAHDRLHIDPISTLPQELVESIYEYLDPVSLHNASLVSRAWKIRAYEPRLWRRLYTLEGWTYNRDHVKSFEERARIRTGFQSRGSRRTRTDSMSFDSERHDKKRFRNQRLDQNESTLSDAWADQVGVVEADDDLIDEPPTSDTPNDAMQDITYEEANGIYMSSPSNSVMDPLADHAFHKTLQSSLVIMSESHGPIINWQKLYSERQRMECNWTSGNFKNFRLPVAHHEYEAHTQCVYTIQYTANYLVSGSRDRSVRIWCLATGRLVLPPLTGHGGSVLCLQFDEKPEEDVIISGGSDSGIIIWRFSTGAKIKVIPNAHTQPVLMLRFDERYLVTCSKDYLIKVWNRKMLSPLDAEYPRTNISRNAEFPDYILNLQEELQPWQQPSLQPLDPYSLLMTLVDHKAAVNAISIVDDQIVSASGDRKIKLWNIKTGTLIRTYSGHTKGIACVQFDGRRIISGSSDNTIRIFDAVTSAQVAFLEGHRDLVRTLQAEFGDLTDPDAEMTLTAEAQKHTQTLRRGAVNEERSSRPFVTGARIPPGGGGTRWTKIVSGSYDETVKIWKRDRRGKWQVARELRQDDALIRAGTDAGVSWVPYPWTTDRTEAQLRLGFPGRSDRPRTHDRRLPGLSQEQPAQAQPSQSQGSATARPASQPFDPSATMTHQSIGVGLASSAPLAPQPLQVAPQVQAPAPAVAVAVAGVPALARPPGRADGPPDTPNARLFKLQFDARRIICCSQQSIIVGWDFANNDEMLMNASYFFGAPYMTGC